MSTDNQLSAKGELRKSAISESIKKYDSLKEYRKDNIKDYNWIISHKLKDYFFERFPDYAKRAQYKDEKKKFYDPEDFKQSQIEKAFAKAGKCSKMREFEMRFYSSYLFCQMNGLLGQIEESFKK